jgi:hypothetical protein
MISEWIVRSDSGRLLVPGDVSASLIRPALTETGFEWISHRGAVGAFVVLTLAGLGTLLIGAGTGWRVPAGILICAITGGAALVMAGNAWVERRVSMRELTFAATMVPAGETVSLEMANVPYWRAMIVPWGVAAVLAGVAVLVMGRMLRRGETPLAHARG